MIHAKNYETVSKFVKVMTKILLPLFSGHGVYTKWRTDGQPDESIMPIIADHTALQSY